METIDLDGDEFWRGEVAVVMRHSRVEEKEPELEAYLRGADWLAGHVLFRTSGSSGMPKLACLSREAILHSAGAVNRHLGVTPGDRWVRALPVCHVGGVGMHARAGVGENEVRVLEGKWDAERFVRLCGDCAGTLSALVPAQVYDLVEAGLASPQSLRGVLVGGGALGEAVHRRALELGWPILRTYGMTEGASQVATETSVGRSSEDWLPVLGHWEAKVDEAGLLMLRGKSLLTAYLERVADGGFVRDDPKVDGWLRSDDRVDLREDEDGETVLRFLERAGDVVKVLGELVSVGKLRNKARELCREVEVVGVPDERLGTKLLLVHEAGVAPGAAEKCLEELNTGVPGYEQVQEVIAVQQLPRTELGKVDWPQLRRLLA
jgi:O-succinylbenzoic acid--CoA ligase